MTNPTYAQIAADFRLWGERFDTGAEMTRADFDAVTIERRVGLLVDSFGPESPVDESVDIVTTADSALLKGGSAVEALRRIGFYAEADSGELYVRRSPKARRILEDRNLQAFEFQSEGESWYRVPFGAWHDTTLPRAPQHRVQDAYDAFEGRQ